MKTKKQRISAAVAKRVGGKLGVDWAKVDLDQFRRGLEVELEHGARDPQTNVTNNDMDLTGKIAWAHLKEFPDYYAIGPTRSRCRCLLVIPALTSGHSKYEGRLEPSSRRKTGESLIRILPNEAST